MVGFNKNRRVLLVGGEGVVLYAPAGKGVMREASISWEVPNFDQQLAETLGGRNKGKSLVILFDGSDQTYRKVDDIPKLSPIDRPRFVKRRLELTFPSYPIRASLEVKPSKAETFGMRAKGEPKPMPTYLFAALPETEQLDRIGNCIYEAGVPIGGFGLLPLESCGLADELSTKLFADKGKKSRWSVLIGQHETGGLRQVVVKDGNLALTRLTPTSEAGTSGDGWVEEVTREFKATLTYISRFGYESEDGLDVVIVCGDVEKQFFDPSSLPVTNFQCINAGDALNLLGTKSFGFDKTNFSDALHAAWSGRRAGLRLPVKIPSIHRIMGPRLAAQVGTGVLALGVVGLLGITGIDLQRYSSLTSQISDSEGQKSLLTREYDQEAKAFDSLPVKPDAVKAAMDIKTLLDTNSVNLRPVLHTLKDALPGDVALDYLYVSHDPSDYFKNGGQPFAGGRAAGAPADPNDPGKIKIDLKFRLPDGLLLEQKVARAEQLRAQLEAAFKGYKVTLAQNFGNMSPTGSMSAALGSGGDKTAVRQDFAEIMLEGAPF
jgi:hypothetical protein